jgi:multicomponent K+:H+ antiporter subunit E
MSSPLRRRLFPQPAVSVAIFATWLLAQNGVSPIDVLSGALLAFLVPRFSARFWPGYPENVRYRALARLFVRVSYDIVVANIRVAVLVLGPRSRLRPSFLEVPLAVESPVAITLLASVISLTPGTVSANVSGDRKTLLVHGLAIDDPAAAVAHIKQRYEAPIKEAFEC